MSSIFRSINQEMAEEIDVGLQNIWTINIQPKTKVLILKNCRSLSAIVNHPDFLRNIKNSRMIKNMRIFNINHCSLERSF